MENITFSVDVLHRFKKEGMGTILQRWLNKENSATKKRKKISFDHENQVKRRVMLETDW